MTYVALVKFLTFKHNYAVEDGYTLVLGGCQLNDIEFDQQEL
jgi:hypothetical protein